MRTLWQDLRYGARMLVKNPVFTLIAVITLALGIGANTAIFSVANAVLLRPLPYKNPDRLVLGVAELRQRNVTDWPFSNVDVFDLRNGAKTTFEDIAAVNTGRRIMPREDGAPEQVRVASVTPNFFRLLGAKIVAGRDFTEDDGRPQPPATDGGPSGEIRELPTIAILSHEYWQQRHGGNMAVLGKGMSRGGSGGPQPQGRATFMREAQDWLRALPGVESVTASTPFPLAGGFGPIRWGLEQALSDPTKFQAVDHQTVLPGYFETLRTPLLAGRVFTEADNAPERNVVVVDQFLAAKAFPGASAVGKRILIRARTPEPEWVEVIGVVGHQRMKIKRNHAIRRRGALFPSLVGAPSVGAGKRAPLHPWLYLILKHHYSLLRGAPPSFRHAA